MTTIPESLKAPLTELLLSTADDKFLLGHRNADWTGLGPILEEDIAFSSIAQDEIAHAEVLYQFIHTQLGGAKPDDLAYGREPREYRCAALVELGDEFDWSRAIVRQFFCDHFDAVRLGRLAASSWPTLAVLAGRLLAEERAHVQHADTWIVRLGRGTPESHDRMQRAIDALWPDTGSLFEAVWGEGLLEPSGVYPRGDERMSVTWHRSIAERAGEAGLTVPASVPKQKQPGGRAGQHTPQFEELLAELCEVYRVEPKAAW